MEGKVALVTGGSRGIGAATARAFASAGARVIITHRDSGQDAENVVRSLEGAGHRLIQASATDSDALSRMAESIASSEGRLDVLVNNAGTTRIVPHNDLEALDDELFDKILRTNVRGAFATIRAVRALLASDGGGTIVNISSLASRAANGSNVAYCASKAAMDNMTMSLARALAPDIRVLSVAPGLIDTQFTGGWSQATQRHAIDHTPLGRIGQPEDVADAVIAACSLLRFTTGAVIPVDGGRPLN